VRTADLNAAMEAFDRHLNSTYSVAWIDCLASGEALGRSLVILGEHAPRERLPDAERKSPYARVTPRPRRLPIDLPTFLLNGHSMRLFNELYYRAHRPGTSLVDFERYFYPLDAIHDWNRMYGRAGFVQYQCVLPLSESPAGLRELLLRISRAGTGSFLAVLKRLGRASFGCLSFPMEGYTLALDFPVRDSTLALLGTLDAVVTDHGGRIYLAKDARAGARAIATGYPKLDAFRDVRRRYGLDRRFKSLQSTRLEL
jgi:hypothetical protein